MRILTCLTATLLVGSVAHVAHVAHAKPAAGSEEEARALIAELARPGADLAALSARLRPTAADYAAVFDAELAKRAEALYGPAWAAGQIVVQHKPDQTATIVSKATTDELVAGTGQSMSFPGGYKKVAPRMKRGLTVYAFKFVVPGQQLGMAYDGLIFVNGHWALFPKPWRLLQG
jgi:hypothetical protein